MQLKAEFTGNVTNDPEVKFIGAKETPLQELRVAINHDKKNRETGEFEKTGDTTWVVVKLWGDRAEDESFEKGDLIRFSGTLVEKHWGDDGKGRTLESDRVESLELVYRKESDLANGFV